MKRSLVLLSLLISGLWIVSNSQESVKFSVTDPAGKLVPDRIKINSDTTFVTFRTPETGFLHEPGSDFSYFMTDQNAKVYPIIGASVRFGVSVPAGKEVTLFFEALGPDVESISIYQGKFGKWNFNQLTLDYETMKSPQNQLFSSSANLQHILDSIPDNSLIYFDLKRFTSPYGYRLQNKKNITIVFQDDAEIICSTKHENVFNILNCRNICIVRGRFVHRTFSDDICLGYVFHMENSGGIELIQCDINGSGSVGVSAENSHNLQVNECYIHENSNAAFTFDKNCSAIKLKNNRLEKNGPDGNTKYSSWSSINREKIMETNNFELSRMALEEFMKSHEAVLSKRKEISQKINARNDSIIRLTHHNNLFVNNSFIADRISEGHMLSFGESFYRLKSEEGDRWSEAFKHCKSVSFDQSNKRVLYIINNENNLLKSVDGGENWILIQNGLKPDLTLNKVICNPYKSSEVIVLASDAIYRTTDAGFTWRLLKQCNEPGSFVIGFNKPHFYIFVCTEGILLSDDSGQSWKNLSINLPKVMTKGTGRTAEYQPITANYITFAEFGNKSLLLAQSNVATYQSNDLGKIWQKINDDYIITTHFHNDEIYLGGINFTKSQKMFAVLYKSNNQGDSWEKIPIEKFEGFGLSGIYKTEDLPGLIIYNTDLELDYLDENLTFRGLNYGVTPHSHVISSVEIRQEGRIRQIALVKNDRNTDIYNYGIWVSDNGLTWERSLHYEEKNWYDGLRQITVSPHNKKEIWCFDRNYKFISFDQGGNWHEVNQYYNFRELYDHHLTDFDFHYQNPDILFITGKSYNGHYLCRYDRTTKGFTKIRETGGNIAVSAEDSNMILTANCEITMDGGWTWSSFYTQLKEFMEQYKVELEYADITPARIEQDGIQINIYFKNRLYIVVSDNFGKSMRII